jgi:hypothetical protein
MRKRLRRREMHEKFILRLTVFGFIAILPVAAQEPRLETPRPDIEQIVHEYILQHPCTGTNCPNVLAKCPAAGCSWNNVGPLP